MSQIKEYIDKEGNISFYFTVYLGKDINGKDITKTRRGFKTKAQAKSEMSKLKYEFDNGLMYSPTSQSYDEIYNLWISSYKFTVKESTLQRTIGLYNNHIKPVFGNLNISDITSIQCQKFANELSQEFVKYKEMYNLSKRIFQYAIKPLNLIKTNPFNDILMPQIKANKSEITFLEKEEFNLFLDAIKDFGNKSIDNYKYYALFRLLAFTGMRRGEALALLDTDFDKNTVTINKTITRGLDERAMIDTPKTDSSIRTIYLDDETVHVINKWIRIKNSLNVVSINKITFPNNRGSYLTLSKPLKVLDRITKRYNLKRITIKDLRHTHCSLLLEAGASIKEVQDRLGHSTPRTTMRVYAHVTEKQKQSSGSRFLKYLEG